MTEIIADNSAAQQIIEKNYRWNFLVNSLDGASFWFGMSFISATIILPLYVSHFTNNPLLIGLIPFLATAGYLVPQLFTSNAVERAPRKKFFPVTLGFFLERVPIFLLAPTAYFLATSQPTFALAIFLVLYAWHTIGAGMIIVGWQDMIGKIIHARYAVFAKNRNPLKNIFKLSDITRPVIFHKAVHRRGIKRYGGFDAALVKFLQEMVYKKRNIRSALFQ